MGWVEGMGRGRGLLQGDLRCLERRVRDVAVREVVRCRGCGDLRQERRMREGVWVVVMVRSSRG